MDWREYEWQYEVIEGRHCIGMAGNLDCLEDALIEVSRFGYNGQEAKEIAEWVVSEHNRMIDMIQKEGKIDEVCKDPQNSVGTRATSENNFSCDEKTLRDF